MNRRDEMNKIIQDFSTSVNLLQVTADEITKSNILDHIRCKIYDLYLINNLGAELKMQSNAVRTLPFQNNRIFTKEELSRYNGKNGMPAYVAVNGTVYDVTNNAAWGAATHFGLTAGNDLSTQFASCHAGHPILQNLPIVGTMVE
ncbi:cytochrome B5 [Caproiciproducens galactitolivorans]|uniref:Cytochrome b5-like heme/steroid binding domain protein n=1 Tax=Caproiciproducens galactitolivorans TaxID=642589 RepID=A0A4Z0YIL6_9FIRM|nr:cytochrome b5 domain-containing protein [Caproiciproducens galactitolivorans]QEY35075.1 cytochrome B5 [Caproiciproducens galactitolivorans]TGJ76702.1 cytochrome b5-like heme/steroid binding domain protein [Caproiciproducens galactitolivorans]